ncbi:MBL fold metallo-hydrolase [Oceanobacillus sp. J11TS1]|uniref:YtnP family quorum-quenching lactonase n=1 Tax=Oceanobacillus sp. J11TS1 TaxID=2807191 RepID=UPI001B057541|nr:MBL fold metallo-hydrolase [Oceanobacillus sp. J11TS1]GIO24460.1 MBL fold metallo-hydrolase [Oceanobacillus sp. J11TS1]
METLQVGRAKLTWLNGGVTHLDGGAMFGVVPKELWAKKYPYNEKNQIELRTDPIFLELDGFNILIDSGIGWNKLSDKQKRNFGVLEETKIEKSLLELGLTENDIHMVLMTHLHYDHANGLTKVAGKEAYESVFKKAKIYVSQTEWDEMQHPNIRSVNTYWEKNWKPIVNQVHLFREEIEVLPGLSMIHTGGHSDGHAIIRFQDGEDCFLHMADIMPTHAHQNKLWVLAYDDYPVQSVLQKEYWLEQGYRNNTWFTFYHDAYYRAIRCNEEGRKIDQVERVRYAYK